MAAITVKPSFGLSDEEVAEMLKASYSHAAEDKAARQLAEEQVAAQQLLDGLEVALAADAALLNETAREQLRGEMQALFAQMQSADAVQLRKATEQLGRASEAFAARRMDLTISTALSGVSVESLEESES